MRRLGMALLLLATAAPGRRAAGGEPASPPEESAAEARVLALSVEDAVRLALAQSESVLAARAAVRGSEGSVVVARSGMLPALSAQAGYTRSYLEDTGSLDPAVLALLGGGLEEETDSYQATLLLEQPLYTGGRVSGALAMAREGRALAGEGVRLAEQRLIRGVHRAYYRVLLSREFASVAAETHKLAGERLKVVEARVAAGAANEFERLRASVQVSNRDAERLRAENARQIALAELLRALSLGQGTAVHLTDTLGPAPGGPAGAEERVPSLEEAFARARRGRPELAQLDRRIAMQGVQARLVWAERRPTVAATASLGGLASDDPFADDHWADTWSVGVSLTWPLFDGLRARGRSIEENAALDQLVLERRAAERGVELEVRRALVELENARRSIETQRQTEREAREGLRLAEVALQNGAAREIDVSDARTELAIARRLHAQALFDWRVALVDLAYATGELRPPEPRASPETATREEAP